MVVDEIHPWAMRPPALRVRARVLVRRRFVEVSATGSSQKPLATTTKRNTYNASFGEEFYVPLDQHHHTRGGGSLAELTLKVMDWDRVGSNDHIGDVRIALGEGSDPRRNYLRPGQQVACASALAKQGTTHGPRHG